MRWVAALLLLSLGVAYAATTWLDGEPPPPAAPTQPATAEERADAQPAHAAAADAALRTADDAALDDGGDDALLREAGTPLPDYDTGPVVRVLHDGRPMADVVVHYLRERDLQQRNQRERSEHSRWEGPELFGLRARTDANGDVRLPPGRGRWFCSASVDGLFGFCAALPRDQVYPLELGVDEQLVVLARHEDNTPAQVGVTIAHRVGGNTGTIWRGEADARGRAVVRHFQFVRPDRRGEQPESFAAVARVPSSPPCVAAFEGRPAPGEPVELVVPPFGALAVQLTDFAGAPLLSPASVGMVTPNPTQTEGMPRIDRGMINQRLDKPAGSAPVVIPCVPIGDAVRPYARFPHDRRSAVGKPLPGPTERGATVAVELPPHESHCVLAGRLRTDDGRIVAAQQLAVTLWEADRVRRTARIETIDDGRFDLVWSGEKQDQPRRIELRYRAAGSGDEPTRWLGASVTTSSLRPGSRLDLGDVVLRPLPPLCAGIVVDDQGQPIAGALVHVQQNREPGKPQPAANNPATLEVMLRNSRSRRSTRGQRDPWRNLPNLRTRTAEDGTFVLDGEMPPGEVRVLADDNRHFAASVPLPAPNQSLRIALDRNGIVRGRVLLPGWIARGAVTLTLRPLEEHRRETDTVRTSIDNRRRFTLEPLRPGRYDLLVTMRNLQGPLATVPDVWVTPGVTNEPRLQPLDLTQSLFRYRLRALDQAGVPLTIDGPIHARLQGPDGTWSEAGFRWQKGRAELVTAHQLAELTFFGRGFEPQKRQLPPGDHDVYLRTLQPAMVLVPGARALCGPIRKVRISAILQGDTGYPSSLAGVDQRSGQQFSFPRWDLGRSSGGWLENSDLVAIPLMQAGKYQIILRAHATESTRTPQVSVTLGTFELKPDGVTTTTVPVDSQAVLEALKRVDAQWQQRQEQQLKRNRQRR